jgi:tetratricopeptide (TPR) repeat protein
MKRNVIFNFIFALLFILPNSWIFANSNDFKSQTDTVRLKTSQPDSGIYYYQKALSIIPKKAGNKRQYDYFFATVHSKLATLYSDLHQVENASLHNSLAFSVATKINSKEIIGKLLLNRGAIYAYKSNYDSATYFYRKALKLSRELSDRKLESKIYVNIGVIQVYQGNTDSAFIYFRKPIAIAEKLNDKELLAGAYNNLGALYLNTGKLDDALSNYKRSEDIYTGIKDSLDIILCEINIANICFTKSDFAGALEYYNRAVKGCLKVNNPMDLAKAYHNIGEVYYNIHAYDDATDYYLKAIKIREKLKDKQGMSSDYTSIGTVQISNNNPKKALEYYNKALFILMKIDYKPGLTIVFNMLGNVYSELNKPDPAIYYLNKANDLAVIADDKITLSSIYFNFANIYKKAADYQKAILYFNKSVELNEQMEDVSSVGTACYNLANIYINLGYSSTKLSEKRGYFQKAYQYAMRAFRIGENHHLLDVKAEAAMELTNVFKGQGDFKQALFYSDIYTLALDSLNKKAQSESAIFAEARWQTEKKQQQINFLEQEKELNTELIKTKELENKAQKLLIYLLIGGVIILLVSAFIIVYFVRRQRKLEFQQQLNKISKLRLENARGRVSPHFLFNSLNSIQDELSDKPDASQRLHAIVNMLRCSLLNIEKPSIPLKEEMEFVENYILLQKIKFLNDLQTEIHIANTDLYDYKIPAMIIQIPVENALKHGLAGKQTGEKILKVDARRENGSLMISVSDNGIGREFAKTNSKVKGTGTGLKVISQTLHLLNSKNEKKIQFSLIDLKNESGENCGTQVDISIPVTFNFDLFN